MKQNYQKSEYSETWLEDGVIIQDINPSVKSVNLVIAHQLIKDRKLASGSDEKKFPVLVYTNNAINIEKEAKVFYGSPEPYVNIKAIAMVMDNFIAAFVAKLVFMIKRNRFPTEAFNSSIKTITDKKNHEPPTEVFNNSIKALKWLERYKD